MSRLSIKAVLNSADLIGQTVNISGWVRSRRDSKAGISFIAVHDGSCFAPIQLVVPNTLTNYEAEILHLSAGCSVEAQGVLVQSAGEGQSVEIQATTIRVLGWVEDPESYPMAKKRHTLEHLRQYAHLRPRTNVIGAVTRVRTVLANAILNYFFE